MTCIVVSPLMPRLNLPTVDVLDILCFTGRMELLDDFEWFRILIPLSRRVRFDFRDLSMFCIIYIILYSTAQLPIQHIPSF